MQLVKETVRKVFIHIHLSSTVRVSAVNVVRGAWIQEDIRTDKAFTKDKFSADPSLGL